MDARREPRPGLLRARAEPAASAQQQTQQRLVRPRALRAEPSASARDGEGGDSEGSARGSADGAESSGTEGACGSTDVDEPLGRVAHAPFGRWHASRPSAQGEGWSTDARTRVPDATAELGDERPSAAPAAAQADGAREPSALATLGASLGLSWDELVRAEEDALRERDEARADGEARARAAEQRAGECAAVRRDYERSGCGGALGRDVVSARAPAQLPQRGRAQRDAATPARARADARDGCGAWDSEQSELCDDALRPARPREQGAHDAHDRDAACRARARARHEADAEARAERHRLGAMREAEVSAAVHAAALARAQAEALAERACALAHAASAPGAGARELGGASCAQAWPGTDNGVCRGARSSARVAERTHAAWVHKDLPYRGLRQAAEHRVEVRAPR